MEQNTINKFEEKLREFLNKHVIVIQGGFLESKYFINKLNYSIEYEILNIEDNGGDNYLKINLNQIYKIEYNKNEIKLFIDNDTIICLSI